MKIKFSLGSSVFLKIFAVMVGTGLALIFSISMVFRAFMEHPERFSLEKNLVNYSNYLVNELGNPPSLIKARELKKKFDFNIQYYKKEIQWQTDEGLLTLDDYEKIHTLGGFHRHVVRPYRRNFYWLIKRPYGRFLFSTQRRGRIEHTEYMTLAMVTVVILLLLGMYLVIRRILKPVVERRARAPRCRF